MHYLPLLPKNKILFTLLISISFFFLQQDFYSQVRIKEKISIKPTMSQHDRILFNQDFPPLVFQIGRPLPFSASITGPGGSASGSGGGGIHPFWFTSFEAINGDYNYSINVSLEAGQRSNIELVVNWKDQGIFFDLRYFRNDSDSPIVYHIQSVFTFNEIPPPPEPIEFDFSMQLLSNVLYGTDFSIIQFCDNGSEIPSLPNRDVTLRFDVDDPDITFYDRTEFKDLGHTFTTTLDCENMFTVMLNKFVTD